MSRRDGEYDTIMNYMGKRYMYHVGVSPNSYNNVPWGMDEQGITVFLVAWMSRQSLLHLKHSRGMDSVTLATGKCMSGQQPDILSRLEIPGGAFNWDWNGHPVKFSFFED